MVFFNVFFNDLFLKCMWFMCKRISDTGGSPHDHHPKNNIHAECNYKQTHSGVALQNVSNFPGSIFLQGRKRGQIGAGEG